VVVGVYLRRDVHGLFLLRIGKFVDLVLFVAGGGARAMA
jgi:hypothetical protein